MFATTVLDPAPKDFDSGMQWYLAICILNHPHTSEGDKESQQCQPHDTREGT